MKFSLKFVILVILISTENASVGNTLMRTAPNFVNAVMKALAEIFRQFSLQSTQLFDFFSIFKRIGYPKKCATSIVACRFRCRVCSKTLRIYLEVGGEGNNNELKVRIAYTFPTFHDVCLKSRLFVYLPSCHQVDEALVPEFGLVVVCTSLNEVLLYKNQWFYSIELVPLAVTLFCDSEGSFEPETNLKAKVQ